MAAHPTAPATVSPGARWATNRLSVSATPRPKPAPTSIISRDSSFLDFSCGAGGSIVGSEAGFGVSIVKPRPCARSARWVVVPLSTSATTSLSRTWA